MTAPRDGLQAVGHRVGIAAGHALLLGAFGGLHSCLRPGPGQDVQALRGQAVKSRPFRAGEAAA